MNFGWSGEMIFIFFLALVLFGPKRMPEIGRQIARLMNEFRRASNEFRSQIESEINQIDPGLGKGQILPPRSAPLGTLANRILNPPGLEKTEPAESAAPKPPAVETAATASASSESVPEPPPAPKVAADA